jgi:hypothetical protein
MRNWPSPAPAVTWPETPTRKRDQGSITIVCAFARRRREHIGMVKVSNMAITSGQQKMTMDREIGMANRRRPKATCAAATRMSRTRSEWAS